MASGELGSFRVRGVVLPDDEMRDLYVVDGKITYEPVADAELVADGWVLPGLVDAHCHIGLAANGAVSPEETEEQARMDRDAGALLVRDCGSPADTRWIDERDDLPRIIRAGRHLARTRRYIRNFAHEIEPEQLVAYVEQEAGRGDGWVKLVGDWIDRGVGDLAPSWPAEVLPEAIETAHAHGARVTAHVFGEDALAPLLSAGIDCIEHGTGLTLDLIDDMAARGVALVPTLRQLENFPGYAAAGEERFPTYADHMRRLYARRRETIMAAYEAGVPLYAGTDAGGVLPHGLIAEEAAIMADYGMAVDDVLAATSWGAREWLGMNPRLSEGDPADLVVYDANPRVDLGVLGHPRRVVLRGAVVL